MRCLVLFAVLLLPSTVRAACSANATSASFAVGPFGVGVRTLTLVDTHRPTPANGTAPKQRTRTLTVELWYPAAAGATNPVRDAPLAAGRPFPLVVNSPGFMDGRLGETYYCVSLASRGYVVASIDFPLSRGTAPGGSTLNDFHNQPGDVTFVITRLLGLARHGFLARGVGAKRIGVTGLSMGGGTTLLAAYHPKLRDRRVRAALPIAPGACFFGEAFYRVAHSPLLVLQGDQDLLVPLATNGGLVFERAVHSDRTLVALARGTHTAFSTFIDFPSSTTYDDIGCAALTHITMQGNAFRGLGGARAGIDLSNCALPCSGPRSTDVPMQATRQHELARIVENAFFDATLKDSSDARCFLAERLAVENADARVETRVGAR